MNKSKIPFIFSLLIYVIYKGLSYWTGEPLLSLLVFLIPVGLLLFNFIIRKKLKYKTWFLSPYNFFLDREDTVSKSEISQVLLYDKLLEVVKSSDFKLADSNQQKKQILATTSPNFWTWGENIYIEIIVDGNNSVINITSVTIFGSFSWKRNEKNFKKFSDTFEQSLAI